MTLEDQHVLVVGGSGTIGGAVAQATLAAGARVTATASTQESADRLGQQLDGLETAVCDVTEHGAADRLADEVGDVNHLVITAATLTFDGLLEADGAALSAMIGTKLWGALHLCRAFGPRLGGGDSITLTSGMLSRAPVQAAPLAAVNGAIESLGKALAVELAPVRVNVVSPGGIGAEGRIGYAGTADDAAAVYLAAISNPWMSGSVLDVHGAGVY